MEVENFEIERKQSITKKEASDFINWMFSSKEIRNFELKSSSTAICTYYEKNKNIKLTIGFVQYNKNRYIKIKDKIYEKEKIKDLISIPGVYEVIKDFILE